MSTEGWTVQKILVTVEFYGEVPGDPDDADQWADRVGDQIVSTLERIDNSQIEGFSIADWSSELAEL